MKKTIYASIGFFGFHLYYMICGDYDSDIWKATWFSVLSLMIFFILLDSIGSAFKKSIKGILWVINSFWILFFISEVYLMFDIQKYRNLVEVTNKWSSGFFLLLGIILMIIYKALKNDNREIKR